MLAKASARSSLSACCVSAAQSMVTPSSVFSTAERRSRLTEPTTIQRPSTPATLACRRGVDLPKAPNVSDRRTSSGPNSYNCTPSRSISARYRE